MMRMRWIGLGVVSAISSLMAAPAIALASAQIVEIEAGSVRVRRSWSSVYRHVREGARVEYGDLLWTTPGARVVVRCPGNQLWRVPVNRPAGLRNGCPTLVRSDAARGDEEFLALLNGYFVAETLVAEAQPQWRWAAVEQATGYWVQVQSDDEEMILWQTETEEPQIQYGGAPLQPEQTYQVTIVALGKLDEEWSRSFLMRTVSADQQQRTEAAVADIEAADLSPEATAITLAAFYEGFGEQENPGTGEVGLLLAGIKQLEPLVEQGEASTAVHQMLGDFYLRLGQMELAEVQYQEALELAEMDEISRVEALIGLAKVAAAEVAMSEAVGNEVGARQARLEAYRYLTQAQVSSAFLGDRNRLEQLQELNTRLD